jgi:hypothetical protein
MGFVFAGTNTLACFLEPQLVIPFSAPARATIFISLPVIVFARINNLAYFLQPQLVIPFSATARAALFISSIIARALVLVGMNTLAYFQEPCLVIAFSAIARAIIFTSSSLQWVSLCRDKQSSLFLTASASYNFFRNCKSNNLYLFICTMGFVFAGTNNLAYFLQPQLVKPLSATARETFNNFIIFHVLSQTRALDNKLEYLSMVTTFKFSSGITKKYKIYFYFLSLKKAITN